MDQNTEFLNYIYQNSQMGIEAVQTLLKAVEDPQTTEHLQQQQKAYKAVNILAFQKLHDMGRQEKDISAMQKIMSYISINAQTLVKNTPGHIAEMMMQGNTMGIIDLTKNLKKYSAADQEIVALGRRLLKLEEDSFDQWKLYLGLTVE